MRRTAAMALVAAALLLAACGGDDEDAGTSPATATTATQTTAPPSRTTPTATGQPAKPVGTKIKLADSEFGRVLFDGRGQAIYLFTKDGRDRTRCYGACADAWPPVYTKAQPRALDGVRQGLLGTIRRSDGRLQATYKGQPLYFYAHEGPNEIRCQNVDEFGGTWLVVKGDGEAVR